jgi:hypothetical protein
VEILIGGIVGRSDKCQIKSIKVQPPNQYGGQHSATSASRGFEIWH